MAGGFFLFWRNMSLIDDPKQKKLEERAKRRRERDLGDIRKILSIPEGRRFYWRILSVAGIFRTSWTGQVEQTLVNEGSRNNGLIFLNDLMEASPTSFVQLQREANAEAKSQQKDEE